MINIQAVNHCNQMVGIAHYKPLLTKTNLYIYSECISISIAFLDPMLEKNLLPSRVSNPGPPAFKTWTLQLCHCDLLPQVWLKSLGVL